MSLLLVAGGGAIGAMLRYLVGRGMVALLGPTVMGTLVVNVTGSFLIGFIMYAVGHRLFGNSDVRLFAVVGVLGGFTTFSAFSYEVLRMLEAGAIRQAAVYSGASVLLGLAAATAGMIVGREV